MSERIKSVSDFTNYGTSTYGAVINRKRVQIHKNQHLKRITQILHNSANSLQPVIQGLKNKDIGKICFYVYFQGLLTLTHNFPCFTWQDMI